MQAASPIHHFTSSVCLQICSPGLTTERNLVSAPPRRVRALTQDSRSPMTPHVSPLTQRVFRRSARQLTTERKIWLHGESEYNRPERGRRAQFAARQRYANRPPSMRRRDPLPNDVDYSLWTSTLQRRSRRTSVLSAPAEGSDEIHAESICTA
jgi:hypothetical protein